MTIIIFALQCSGIFNFYTKALLKIIKFLCNKKNNVTTVLLERRCIAINTLEWNNGEPKLDNCLHHQRDEEGAKDECIFGCH